MDQYILLLRPPNFHRHRGVLQCARRSFWALFPDNCPSLWQRHLIPVWTWTWTHGEISRWRCRPPSPARPLPHSQESGHCT